MKRISWLASAVILAALSGCTEGEVVDRQVETSRPVPITIVNSSNKTSSLRFPGRVRAAQRADLTFNVPGQVIELPVEEGQLINKGDLVARLDDANYKIQMRSALAKYNKTRTDYSRVEQLWQRSQEIGRASCRERV